MLNFEHRPSSHTRDSLRTRQVSLSINYEIEADKGHRSVEVRAMHPIHRQRVAEASDHEP